MIIRDLKSGVAALHNADAYFSASPACLVLWDGEKEESEKKLHATAKALQAALDTVGVAGIVTEVEIQKADNLFALARFSVIYLENLAMNRGTRGSGRIAHNLAVKGWALCEGQSVGHWSPLEFEGLQQASVSHEGLEAWELQLQTRVLYDHIATCLADEAGTFLADETGSPLIVSPTDP